jgi:Gpi18-like mannosyltransferase
LRTGSIGAFSLLAVLFAILLLQKERSFWSGVLFSLTILKPPQGVTILLLAGIWLLARRDWRAIQGMAAGGIALLVIGLIQDPLWLMKFRTASSAVMDRTQGVHSNVWSFAYLMCDGVSPCSTLLGAAGSLCLLGLGGFMLWKKQAQVTVWEAMSFVIPIGFVATVYLWEYDQILYVIPAVWVVGTLIQKTKSYIHAALFLILLIFYAFFAVGQLGVTEQDLWSFGNTLIVLAGVGLASILKEKPARVQPAKA